MNEGWDQSLPRVVGLLRAGLPAADAWRRAGVEIPASPAGVLDRAVRAADGLALRTGASLAAMLGAIAGAAAEAHESRALREAALAGPRLSARILAWLPVVGVALGALVDARTVRVLVLTPVGWTLVVLAASLTVVGRAWTARIVSAAGRRGEGDDTLILAAGLICAAVEAGAPVPSALRAVGEALGESGLVALGAVSITAAERARPAGDGDAWSDMGLAIAPALDAGASPVASLTALAQARSRRARTEAAIAAGEMGVRVALPLALCLLPAFMAVGLVPLLIAVVGGVVGHPAGV